jgi:hypothetical protein
MVVHAAERGMSGGCQGAGWTIAASRSLEGATAALTISVSILAFSAWISPKKHAVTPAILIGLFGYMIGTFVALAVAAVLR